MGLEDDATRGKDLVWIPCTSKKTKRGRYQTEAKSIHHQLGRLVTFDAQRQDCQGLTLAATFWRIQKNTANIGGQDFLCNMFYMFYMCLDKPECMTLHEFHINSFQGLDTQVKGETTPYLW